MRFALLAFFFCLSQCCFAQHWESLNSGVNRAVTKLYYDSISSKLYVGGQFNSVDGQTIWGMATWNGTNWDSLGHGIDDPSISNFPGSTWAMTRYGNYLYIGGNFRMAGNLPNTVGLARWDGSSWSAVPGSWAVPGSGVKDMIVDNNDLYICGVFDSIGGIPASDIAKWNGSSWSAIGFNYPFDSSGYLTRMSFYHNRLYVAGVFSDPSGNTCHLASWDGNSWIFDTVVARYGFVNDFAVYNDELFVSGAFYSSAGNTANCIVRWNDTLWKDVGGSVTIGNIPYPSVTEMQVYNGKLYCAGSFEKIGGINANCLAVWDGIQWCAMSSSFDNGGVNLISFYNDTLYAGGWFQNVDNMAIPYIAKWTGGNYVDTCGVISTGIPESEISSFSIFPNPANDQLTIQFNDGFSKNSSLRILNSIGQIVLEQELSAGEKTAVIDISGFAEGIYFLNIPGEKSSVSQKLIIER